MGRSADLVWGSATVGGSAIVAICGRHRHAIPPIRIPEAGHWNERSSFVSAAVGLSRMPRCCARRGARIVRCQRLRRDSACVRGPMRPLQDLSTLHTPQILLRHQNLISPELKMAALWSPPLKDGAGAAFYNVLLRLPGRTPGGRAAPREEDGSGTGRDKNLCVSQGIRAALSCTREPP